MGTPLGQPGQKLVVSYAAIQAAQQVFAQATSKLEDAFSSIKSVGGEDLHAHKLDEALDDWAADMRTVSTDMTEHARALATFLHTSEEVYRYVDRTALTRAVPYDPNHPSPTMVVRSQQSFSPGLANDYIPGGAAQGGTTVVGVPSGADGGGTVEHVDRATAIARGRAAPAGERAAVAPSVGGNGVVPAFSITGPDLSGTGGGS